MFPSEIVAKVTPQESKRYRPAKVFVIMSPYDHLYIDESSDEIYTNTRELTGGNDLTLKIVRPLTAEEGHMLFFNKHTFGERITRFVTPAPDKVADS